GVSFAAEPGEIVGLIGPNGAGKTTAFNVITRLYTPDEGDVRFEGKSLLGVRPSGVVTRGIARTFQNVELFRGMSVLDNVRVGAHARHGDQGADDLLYYVNLHSLRYRPVKALHGISLDVAAGELVAVLGANGAGKTTTLRAVSGTVRRTGDVVFDGRKLPRRPDAAARAGIAHVPEGRGTFSELSVW